MEDNLRRLFWGPQLREEIKKVAPIFLDPSKAKNSDEAFHALSVVLIAYSLGSRTAHAIIVEKSKREPNWIPPTPEMAREIVQQLYKIKQYLPYLIPVQFIDFNQIYNTIVTMSNARSPINNINQQVNYRQAEKVSSLKQYAKTQIGYVAHLGKSEKKEEEEASKNPTTKKISPLPIHIISRDKHNK